jgi:outer membrane lipoprotein-sorting protein
MTRIQRLSRRAVLALGVCGTLLCGAGGALAEPPTDEPSARELLDRVDDVYRSPRGAKGQMTMKVVHPKYEREMTMDFWAKGKEKTLVRIVEPKKDRRTATLKNGNNIYNYLPKVDRTIKVPASMMGGSWMGSDFTNDDLVKESRMADDYNAKVTFRGKRAGTGERIVVVTCLPKPNAAVVWGKVMVVVRSSDFLPLETRYYKENGQLARRLTFSEFEKQDGRLIPTRMTMVPVAKKGHRTEIKYGWIDFDATVPDSTFSVANLRK